MIFATGPLYLLERYASSLDFVSRAAVTYDFFFSVQIFLKMSSVTVEARSMTNVLSYLIWTKLAPLVFLVTVSFDWSWTIGLSTYATTYAIYLEITVSSKSMLLSWIVGFGLIEQFLKL